jgi:hypothetical protein
MATIFRRIRRVLSQKTPKKSSNCGENPAFPAVLAHHGRYPQFRKPVFGGAKRHLGLASIVKNRNCRIQ